MCHKTKDFVLPKALLLGVDGDGGGDDDDGRISSNLQPPLPIAPRDEISRSGKPLTPILYFIRFAAPICHEKLLTVFFFLVSRCLI